jgi:opacity protein-like surface antigen
MGGARLPVVTLVSALALAGASAHAADYTPQPQPIYIQPVIEEAASWYLRGDIGFSNQNLRDMTNPLDVNNTVTNVGFGFDSSGIYGIGIGYYFNNWLRFDLTGEYRAKANFHGTKIVTSGGSTYTDEYTFSKSEWLFLANAYVDLGTWYNFTPFIGAGAGAVRINISSFQDVNTPTGGVAFAPDNAKWNFAWAVHAGVAYKVSKNFHVELSYRYVDLGDAQSGILYTYDGLSSGRSQETLKHITSHDIRLGVRFTCCEVEPVRQQIIYQPQYQYQPPIQYQPPLRSRG